MAVASSEYDGITCDQLAVEYTEVETNLASATSRQNSAQTTDAITVFLILVPFSALTGDAEGDVARYKGEKIAIERAMEKNTC